MLCDGFAPFSTTGIGVNSSGRGSQEEAWQEQCRVSPVRGGLGSSTGIFGASVGEQEIVLVAAAPDLVPLVQNLNEKAGTRGRVGVHGQEEWGANDLTVYVNVRGEHGGSLVGEREDIGAVEGTKYELGFFEGELRGEVSEDR